jgi:peptidoglycan/xylan/chitin deacetylase (PgdA/CDA1 family)
MERKNKKDSSQNKTQIFILFLVIFCITYFIFSVIAGEYVARKEAVSPGEEASYTLGSYDLEALYNHNSNTKKDNLLILGYHQIRDINFGDTVKSRLFITPPEIFEREMQFLKDHNYEVISLEEYLEYKSFNKFLKAGEKKVVLTFDDGYASQFENAFPILKKYNYPATFFIYTDCINKHNICMTWDNLEELSSAGIKIANHSLHHQYLPDLTFSDIKKEIKGNEDLIKSKLGDKYFSKIFAYPFGASSEKVENALRELGYNIGVGVFPNFYKKDVGSLYLHRYLLGDKFQFFEELFQ